MGPEPDQPFDVGNVAVLARLPTGSWEREALRAGFSSSVFLTGEPSKGLYYMASLTKTTWARLGV